MKKFWSDPIGQVMFEAAVEGGGGGAAGAVEAGLAGGGEADPIGDAIRGSLKPAEEKVEAKVEEKQQTAEELAEAEELKKIEDAIKVANPTIKGSMDVARHQAVLTRTRNKYDAQVKELNDKLEQLKWAEDGETQAALEALSLADKDQKKFVELLMKDERFAKIIQFKEAQAEARREAAADRPRPNAKTPDGSFEYYDDAGLEQLLDWHGQKVLTQAEQKLLEKVESRFGPIEQEFKARNVWNQTLEKQRTVLETARSSWPGFKEHEGKIKEALFKDKNLGLEDAYRQVVITAYQEQTKVNREKLRAELLEELHGKKAAAQSDKPGGGVERQAAEAGDDPIGDAIRRSIKNLER
jgi:hypothetical protein